MKNEIAISNKSNAFSAHLSDSVRKMNGYKETKNALETISCKNETIMAMITEQVELSEEQLGYIFGMIKANLDTLPPVLAEEQKLNGIPLEMLVKLKVDEHVLEVRKHERFVEMTYETKYWNRYRRLCEMICGYGYNCSFITERFEQYFPKLVHCFVRGFANGYSSALHTIAAEEGIQTIRTDPVTQDIWKNWPFFEKSDCREYSLEGEYLYMYHGGWNCSGDPNTPYGNNVKVVNTGLYEKLRARDVSKFTNMDLGEEFNV